MSIRQVLPTCSEKSMHGNWPAEMQVLEQIPAEQRLPFLAVVEQHAKQDADLQMLRFIKEYRLSTKPLKSA